MTAQLTRCRLAILDLLYDHRILTTSQIHREVRRNDDRRKDTWRDLAKLRELELIKGYALDPTKGNASEFYWHLTKKGAAELGLKPLTTKVKNPEPYQLEFKTHQLELAWHVKRARLILFKPQHFNAARPKPYETPQSIIMLKYLQTNFPNRNSTFLTLSRPTKINDYIAYDVNYSQFFIFILCPPDAGRKFWEGRAKLYKRFSELYGRTWAVFTSAQQRTEQLEKLLKEHKIASVELTEIPNLLKTARG